MQMQATSTQAVNIQTTSPLKERVPGPALWWIWTFAVVVAAVLISTTLKFAPFLFVDELMNVDLGRVILNPATDWSIAWMAETGKPVFLLSYIGPVLQELSYRVIGELGPRYSALLGALLAATMLVKWLITRGAAETIAFVLGLAFFLDPLFVQAYTTGRVDGWAMLFCFFSAWLMRQAAPQQSLNRNYKLLTLFSGASAALALLIWPSAGFLFPLLLLELIVLSHKNKPQLVPWHSKAVPFLLFGAGFMASLILLLLPIATQVLHLFSSIIAALKLNLIQGDAGTEQALLPYLLAQSINLLRVLKFTPVILLVSLLGCFSMRHKGLVLGLLCMVLLVLNTVVYTSRVLYLLPYLILLAAVYLRDIRGGKQYSLAKHIILSLLLVWSIGLSLVARTAVALQGKEERVRDLINDAGGSMIGHGRYNVYVPYEFYYFGRSANWNMYHAYLSYGVPLSVEVMQEILPNVDYVIIVQPSKELEQEMLKDGWLYKGTYHLYNPPAEPFNGITTNEIRIRNLYHILNKPYGPYKFYARSGHGN